jgi:hypothetical protein
MTKELSKILEEDNPLNLKEKIGVGLVSLSVLPIIPYVYNTFIAESINKPESLTSIANHSGNAAHLGLFYMLISKLDKKITDPAIILATTYHVLGEIFHSEIAQSLPQILPGTPDIKDIPLTITMGLGIYLTNKKFQPTILPHYR